MQSFDCGGEIKACPIKWSREIQRENSWENRLSHYSEVDNECDKGQPDYSALQQWTLDRKGFDFRIGSQKPPPSNNAIVKKAQKAARERARIHDFGEKAPAPAVHTMTNRRRDLQKKLESLLLNNGLIGQFTAPTKDTVKKWRADPFAGLSSPLYVALLQPFLTNSCGYEHDLKMLKEMEAFRDQRNANKRKDLSKSIYDAYMSPNAPKEVFLPKKMIDAVVCKSSLPKPSLYNAVIKEVKGRLELVHPRFIVTAPFKQLEELYN